LNYLSARKRTDGRWDFTQRNDDRVWPIGYCSSYGPKAAEWAGQMLVVDQAFAQRYHDDGHVTAEEAVACYHRFLIDQRLVLTDPPEKPKELHECAVADCPNFTAGSAHCSNWHAWLCDTHRTPSVAADLMPVSAEIWSS